MFSSNLPGGAHDDVLSASPDTPEKTATLVEEIKSRGRVAISSGNYPLADALYSKAIELSPSAVLYSNRSLARMNLGKLDESISDSMLAVELDDKYVKGHWRLAQGYLSQKRYQQAKAAFEAALKIEPGNKAVKKELDKCKAKIEQEEMFDDGPPPISPVKPKKEAKASKTTTTKPKKSSTSSSAPPAAPAPTEEDEADDFNKSDHVRGYKLNAAGKKTSFFNKDLSEEDKKLIGDIAPKKISSAMDAATPAMKKGEEGVSVWNSAGTWEEKDVTKWAEESVKRCLSGISIDLPCGGIEAEDPVLKDSSASVAKVRGKTRFIFEFNVSFKFAATVDGEAVAGTANFEDVAPDCDGDYECQIEWDGGVSNAIRMKGNKHIRDGAFKEEVENRMAAWVESFKSKYK